VLTLSQFEIQHRTHREIFTM